MDRHYVHCRWMSGRWEMQVACLRAIWLLQVVLQSPTDIFQKRWAFFGADENTHSSGQMVCVCVCVWCGAAAGAGAKGVGALCL